MGNSHMMSLSCTFRLMFCYIPNYFIYHLKSTAISPQLEAIKQLEDLVPESLERAELMGILNLASSMSFLRIYQMKESHLKKLFIQSHKSPKSNQSSLFATQLLLDLIRYLHTVLCSHHRLQKSMDLSDYKPHQRKTNLQPIQLQSAWEHKLQFLNQHRSNMLPYLSHTQERIHLATGLECYRASCYLILRSLQQLSLLATKAQNLRIV